MDPLLRQELDHLTARMCRALNDPKRLMLLYLLGQGPRTVSELCEELEASQSNVSQHLGVLRDRGLVESQRDGSYVTYSLRHPRVLEAINLLREIMSEELARQRSFSNATPGA